MSTRWRAPAADALRIVPLDDLVAIFHRPSGITHLVVSPVPELLDLLAGRWQTFEQIVAAFGVMPEEHVVLREKLEELTAAGLTEAA